MTHVLSLLHSTKTKSLAFIITLCFAYKYLNKKTKNVKDVPSNDNKVGVNAKFFAQVKKLLPIIIPSVSSKEVGLLCSLAAVLIARTYLDIWFSGFNGSVVKSIVSRDKNAFKSLALFEFGLMMWPLSIVNNLLKLNISALSLSFRNRLTKYAHETYLNGITYFKLSNLDNRIQNADQLLTEDIAKFSDNLTHLYSDSAKPLVDIILFSIKLGQALGKEAPVYMIGYFMLSAVFLRAISPSFAKFTAKELKLEGEFRFSHSRIIAHSEEIAFYSGGQKEKSIVNSAFDRISRHIKTIYSYRFLNGIIDSVAVKYCATMLAYYLISRPVFDPRYATSQMGALSKDPVEIMEDYSRNSGYLVNLSQAVGRIVLAGRDLTRFAGYTSRVAGLFEVLEDVKKGRYERSMVSKDKKISHQRKLVTEDSMKGVIATEDNIIKFDKVPILTPNGDILVKEISFTVESGMNCLITGPNGCGKSSLFRILGGLWPLFGGKLTKPENCKLFYVPQKPYLALGTLRDQVIYPDNEQQALEKGYDDIKLTELLDSVHLKYLITREGGYDAIHDWSDVLSGGEKQRIAMARLFYHRPQFAILDECTSAVSMDVEGHMYTHARNLGITLFTVSHRMSLFKYHEYLLRFDGEGGYEFSRLNHDDEHQAFKFGHGKSNVY